jgi:nicotinamidase/pyrazinamidase
MDEPPVTYGAGTALVVVDLQNDFADPNGSLYVRGGEDVVAVANAQIRQAREAGSMVVYTQDWHPAHTPHFAQDGGVWPVHCVADSWGAELVPGLVVDGPTVHKGTGGEDGYSGFSVRDVSTGRVASTELARLLSDGEVSVVVICGLALDYCVKETALDARRLGYEVLVLLEGTRPVELHAGDGERALAAMEETGVRLR